MRRMHGGSHTTTNKLITKVYIFATDVSIHTSVYLDADASRCGHAIVDLTGESLDFVVATSKIARSVPSRVPQHRVS
jgi:hypothetical protein